MLKVLMVDDELPIRKWFSKTFKTLPDVKVDLVGAASNGEEALAMFREKEPDVIFTDIKMPVMDGLTLLRMVKRERPATEVVLVTSYDEFQYAREAIAQHACGYLLKTEANAQALTEILKKVLATRRTPALDKEAVSLRFSQEIYLNRLLTDEGAAQKCTGEELSHHGIQLRENSMFAVAFQPNNFDQEKLSEAFANAGVENVVYYPYQKSISVALANTACIDQLTYQSQAIFQFAEKVSRCFGSPAGTSGLYYKYSQIPAMIAKSIAALNLSFYEENPRRVYDAQRNAAYESLEPALSEWEREIAQKSKTAPFSDTAALIRDLLAYLLKQSPCDVAAVKGFLFRVLANCYMAVYQNRLEVAERISLLHQDIDTSASFAALRERVEALLAQLLAERTRQCPQYSVSIARAVEYLEKNFACVEGITEIADHVNLNPDYFCRLFRSETGVTFSHFLNSTRMNQAAWLLNNTELKSYEVAARVGYANQGYFSKLFKRQFHMTPYEFRCLRGAAPEEE